MRQLWPKAINRWCLNTFNLITIYGYILRKTKPPPYTFLRRVYVLLLLIRSFCLQHDDLSPFEIKIQALESQIEELTASIKSDQQLWLRQQGELVALTQELETNNKQMIKLQTENTGMQQKKIRLDGTTPQNVTFLREPVAVSVFRHWLNYFTQLTPEGFCVFENITLVKFQF